MRDYLMIALACAALALLTYGGFQRNAAAKAKAEVKVLKAEVVDLEAAVETATRAGDAWRATHAAADRALRECVAEWDRSVQAGHAAAQQAQAARQQLDRERAAWRELWSRRGEDCTQSLYAMQAACAAEIGAY